MLLSLTFDRIEVWAFISGDWCSIRERFVHVGMIVMDEKESADNIKQRIEEILETFDEARSTLSL